jgi:toxin ParE1/3/4
MRVEYSKRAVADLQEIAANSRRIFGDRVAAALEMRIRKIVEQIRQAPESAPRVIERPGVRVVLLIRYPYKIFYRILGDTIKILYIRHTARRAENDNE